jgi:hypothetical protein
MDSAVLVDARKYAPWALIVGASEGVGAELARLLAASAATLRKAVDPASLTSATRGTAMAAMPDGGAIVTIKARLKRPERSTRDG